MAAKSNANDDTLCFDYLPSRWKSHRRPENGVLTACEKQPPNRLAPQNLKPHGLSISSIDAPPYPAKSDLMTLGSWCDGYLRTTGQSGILCASSTHVPLRGLHPLSTNRTFEFSCRKPPWYHPQSTCLQPLSSHGLSISSAQAVLICTTVVHEVACSRRNH
jgi:hypothetical protein